MKKLKIISGIMYAIANISFVIAGFVSGIQDGLITLGIITTITSGILYGISIDKDD